MTTVEPRRIGLALLLAVGALLASAAPASADQPGITVDASVDGVEIRGSSDGSPVRLQPVRDALVHVAVRNDSTEPIEVDAIRLDGQVVGLTFFAYDTAVGMHVPAGGTDELSFRLDLRSLDGQATGLVRGSVSLLDADRDVLASTGAVWDVRGDLTSVYGLFGTGVALLTAISLLGALVALARHRLHPNRWWRAVRFLTPGLGVGLTAVFLLSALRTVSPRPESWIPLLAVGGAIGAAVGFLTPAPDDPDDLDGEDDLEEEASPVDTLVDVTSTSLDRREAGVRTTSEPEGVR